LNYARFALLSETILITLRNVFNRFEIRILVTIGHKTTIRLPFSMRFATKCGPDLLDGNFAG